MTRQLSLGSEQEILRQAEIERARVMRQAIASVWAWLFASRQVKAPVGPAIGAAAE
ncbi:MAG: RSP_7527 family protein [Alphaproteobacteria bacterium]